MAQIKSALHKDFVPYFLAAHKPRVDSTNSRIEKSSNNQFQYKSWSQQKFDLLIKPFIVCCADGYFIECYGPFQANHNDAKILEYILETDKNLIMLLQSNTTLIFLDRGIEYYN